MPIFTDVQKRMIKKKYEKYNKKKGNTLEAMTNAYYADQESKNYISPPEKSSKTLEKAIQLLKEVESTHVIKRVKTKKVNDLLKKVESIVKEHERN